MKKQHHSNFKMYVVMAVVALAVVIVVEGLNKLPTSQNKYALDTLYCERDEDCRFKESCGCRCQPEPENIYQANYICDEHCLIACNRDVSYSVKCLDFKCSTVFEQWSYNLKIASINPTNVSIINTGQYKSNLSDNILAVFLNGRLQNCTWNKKLINSNESAICIFNERCESGYVLRITSPKGIEETMC